jgi:hypothetical protein
MIGIDQRIVSERRKTFDEPIDGVPLHEGEHVRGFLSWKAVLRGGGGQSPIASPDRFPACGIHPPSMPR